MRQRESPNDTSRCVHVAIRERSTGFRITKRTIEANGQREVYFEKEVPKPSQWLNAKGTIPFGMVLPGGQAMACMSIKETCILLTFTSSRLSDYRVSTARNFTFIVYRGVAP